MIFVFQIILLPCSWKVFMVKTFSTFFFSIIDIPVNTGHMQTIKMLAEHIAYFLHFLGLIKLCSTNGFLQQQLMLAPNNSSTKLRHEKRFPQSSLIWQVLELWKLLLVLSSKTPTASGLPSLLASAGRFCSLRSSIISLPK